MPSSLTPVARYTTDQIVAPVDGDDLDAADSLAALQLLADRAFFARTALEAQNLWSGDFAVDAGGTATVFVVRIGAILSLTLGDSASALRVGTASATTIGVTKVEGTPGTLGATARFWYVYAFLKTDGTVDYAISTTAPDASRKIKGGDFSRAYLGCFRTTAAGAPLPGRKAAGRWIYRRSALASNETRVLNASASAGPADLDLSTLVPPHARIASLGLACVGGDGGFSVSIACDGDTSDIALRQSAEIGVTSPLILGDVECSSAQVVDYTTVRGAATGSATAFVHGFYE